MALLVHMVRGVAGESFDLLRAMAPYLLFGFFFAGVLHVVLSPGKVARHFGPRSLASVLKASLFGVPLPLCSCGVIPAALSLKKEGASTGAVLAFLISTPTSGVDSVLATYALFGGPFAAYRVAATFAAGVLAGVLVNALLRERPAGPAAAAACPMCGAEPRGPAPHRHRALQRAAGTLRYAFIDLVDDVAAWLVIGLVAGGAIAFFVPEGFFAAALGGGWRAYIVTFLIGAPMYICATGSIPIAASMMAKGLSPGAAFVFLLSGPATNSVTFTVIARELGRPAAAVYLGAIFVASMTFGFLLDTAGIAGGVPSALGRHAPHAPFLPPAVEAASELALLALVGFSFARRVRRRCAPPAFPPKSS